MARIRTIKPEFWSDEKLSECSLSARLVFIGLISFADDEGRLEYSPARIRMQIFPCGSVKPAALTEWMGELSEHSLIRRYVVDFREYIDIPGFTKHQRINRPTPSKFPRYSASTHAPLTEPSVSPTAGSGREGKGSGRDHKNGAVAPDVEGLNVSAFNEWVEYHRSIGKPYKPQYLASLAKKLVAFGDHVAQQAAVTNSIDNTYQGLFAPKAGPNGNQFPAPETKWERGQRALAEYAARASVLEFDDGTVRPALDGQLRADAIPALGTGDRGPNGRPGAHAVRADREVGLGIPADAAGVHDDGEDGPEVAPNRPAPLGLTG